MAANAESVSPPSTSEKTRRRFVGVVAVFAAIGGLLFGYDTGVISGALLFMGPDLGLTSLTEGLVTSFLLIGAAAGAFYGGRIADRAGRRLTLIGAAIVFIVGTAGCAFATDVPVMIVARFVLGIAVGAASIVVPMYIGEIAPTAARGRLVSLNSLMIVGGQLLAYIVNAFLAPFEAWRLMLGLAAVPAVVLAIGMLFLPDTPAWYDKHGRTADARKILQRTHSADDADRELTELRKGREAAASSGEMGFRAAMREPWIRTAILILIGVAVLQQCTGVNSIIYFAPTLLSDAGLSANVAVISSIGIGVISVVAVWVGLRLVDRISRRRLIMGGLAGAVVFLIALGIVFPFTTGNTAMIFVALGLMIAFLAFQQSAVGTVTWLLLSELAPAQARGIAMGIGGIFVWLSNFAIALVFLPLVDAIGTGATFLVFAGLGAAGIVFVRFFVPETKDASLHEIEETLKTGAIPIIQAP